MQHPSIITLYERWLNGLQPAERERIIAYLAQYPQLFPVVMQSVVEKHQLRVGASSNTNALLELEKKAVQSVTQ